MPQSNEPNIFGDLPEWFKKLGVGAEELWGKKIDELRTVQQDLKNKPEVYTDLEKPKESKYLNELAQEIMQVNQEKGFNDEPLNIPIAIALMHSELSEALEADRKHLMDDKLPHRNGVEVELADCIIRILHCSARAGYDIHGAVREKLDYNKTRPYKHGKNY